MTTIKITKMQGCGNDFVILEYEEFQKLGMEMYQAARFLCNRNFGIGADGLIIPRRDVENADIGWFFYNSDGSTAQMCGNGIRCFARYVYDKGYVNKKEFTVDTLAGIVTPRILDNKTVYCSGMSFKDRGKKYTFIYKVVEQFFVDDLIGRVVEIVSNGNVIES